MNGIETFFWAAFAMVVYTYLGYGLIVWVWAKCIRHFCANKQLVAYEPEVTLVVPAYNEADIIESKVANCLTLDYPAHKLQLVFITDGSTDHSADVLAPFRQILHLHAPERRGKSMAENRAMNFVSTPYVIFTDCNSYLNPEAVREMVKHYQDPQVGAVSGEKKVIEQGSASGAGEGLYWKYESLLKRCDSEIHSLMGAAGELISFRSSLFQPLEHDTILDDFIQSIRIVKNGYKVVYEPKAYAMESPSSSLSEEMKRKIRISAGGWQSMVRLKSLLNPIPNPKVTFLYVSHRVLRWSITPLLLALLLPLNILLCSTGKMIYFIAMAGQVMFYLSSWLGWQAETRGIKSKLLLVPLYFTMMNLAVFAGFMRYLRKSQPAAWEKAGRSVMATSSH